MIVNGSPKGEYRLTLQHSLYMLVHEKDIAYRVLHVMYIKLHKEMGWIGKQSRSIQINEQGLQ